jgi:hypothetical protein
MAGNYRKPTDKNHKEIPFKIEVEGKEYIGTVAPSGDLPAFGVPNVFIVRVPGESRKMMSIYRGEWQMQATPEFVKALGKWIENQYK